METSETAARSVICPDCGHENPIWNTICARCGAEIQSSRSQSANTLKVKFDVDAGGRPGCVTAYAMLMGITGAALALGGLIGGIWSMADDDAGNGILILVGGLIGGGLYFLLTRGLWQMRNWARVLMLVFSGLGIASSVITMCASLSGDAGGAGFFTGLLSIIIPGIIFYWFYDNGRLFS